MEVQCSYLQTARNSGSFAELCRLERMSFPKHLAGAGGDKGYTCQLSTAPGAPAQEALSLLPCSVWGGPGAVTALKGPPRSPCPRPAALPYVLDSGHLCLRRGWQARGSRGDGSHSLSIQH